MQPLRAAFVGGDLGTWDVEQITAVRGAGLATVAAVDVLEGWSTEPPGDSAWVLRGVTSNER